MSDSRYAAVAGMDDFLDMIDEQWVVDKLATDGVLLSHLIRNVHAATVKLGTGPRCASAAFLGAEIFMQTEFVVQTGDEDLDAEAAKEGAYDNHQVKPECLQLRQQSNCCLGWGDVSSFATSGDGKEAVRVDRRRGRPRERHGGCWSSRPGPFHPTAAAFAWRGAERSRGSRLSGRFAH